VKLPQQSSGVYSQLWLRSKAMASQDPCTVLRVLGLANSIVPLTSWRKKLMKQVPHSLYQTLYSAGVTKAHPLLTSDLVIQEHRGELKAAFRSPWKGFKKMILGDLGSLEICSPEAKGCLHWCSSSKDLESLSWEASRPYLTWGSCVAVIRHHRMISAGFYS